MKNLFILVLLVLNTLQVERFRDDFLMNHEHIQRVEAKSDDPITVHLIPHSHDDVGWLKTVDNYFYGGDQTTQRASVQYIIDSVVQQLSSNKDYKFSIVEIAFLYRWWNGATQEQREQFKSLLANKQLEIINGGWCMSDEATPYYEDWIDQMTIGLRWLHDTLGVSPTVAWHIDPFGHQASSASMFSRMGYNSFFFSRIDYQDKQLRLENKNMEMVWHPAQFTKDPSVYIFTHINYHHYSPPPGFCFDTNCVDEPIKDDSTLQDYNLDYKAKTFADYFKNMSDHYRSKHLLHTMGEDFHYANALMWYKNIDKLRNYINGHPELGVTITYSTPGEYIDIINHQNNKYPSKKDDFFPYADYQHQYWTGYFTSRTAVKGFVRDFGRFIQAVRKDLSELKMAKSSSYIDSNPKEMEEQIWQLQMAQGILQHHDAVAGTEKQKVANDYIITASRALSGFTTFYKQVKAEEIQNETGQKVPTQSIHLNIFWNETAQNTGIYDRIKSGKNVLVFLYNPGAKGLYRIRINVPAVRLNIVSWGNSNITGNILCLHPQDQNNCLLEFDLEMEQSSSNYVKLVPYDKGATRVYNLKEMTILQSSLTFKLADADSVKITRSSKQIDLTLGSNVESFTMNYNYYQSYSGEGQKSGAYIFRPQDNKPKVFSTIKNIYYIQGLLSVIIVFQGENVITTLLFSTTKDYVKNYGFQVQSFVKGISIADKVGKEVTFNLKTNYLNNNTFWTDSNGLEEQQRVLNYRPTWPLVVNQPVAGNYYPISSHLTITGDTGKKITIMTDRSQGGSVINEGEIQIMIHRRTLFDDSKGVGQPLNETEPDGSGLKQIVRHWIIFGDNHRATQKLNDQKVQLLFAQTSTSTFKSSQKRKIPITVPPSVKLFLRPFQDGSYLMRLHNMDPNSENTVSLGQQWVTTELMLGADRLQSEWKDKQYHWNEENKYEGNEPQQPSFLKYWIDLFLDNIWNPLKLLLGLEEAQTQTQAIQLKPFQIKTFKLTAS